MEERTTGVCVSMCAHACMDMSTMSGWLVSWLVSSQSNYFLNLLSVFSLRLFSLNYCFKVFISFLKTVWNFYLPSHFSVKGHPESQLPKKTSDLSLGYEMMTTLIQFFVSWFFFCCWFLCHKVICVQDIFQNWL